VAEDRLPTAKTRVQLQRAVHENGLEQIYLPSTSLFPLPITIPLITASVRRELSSVGTSTPPDTSLDTGMKAILTAHQY
jgi:hypothetical protein